MDGFFFMDKKLSIYYYNDNNIWSIYMRESILEKNVKGLIECHSSSRMRYEEKKYSAKAALFYRAVRKGNYLVTFRKSNSSIGGFPFSTKPTLQAPEEEYSKVLLLGRIIYYSELDDSDSVST